MHRGTCIGWLLLLASAALLSGGRANAAPPEEPDAVLAACRGFVSDLLHDLREGDDAARTEAERRLIARARYTLPYVLSAAESTTDAAWRNRCRTLAARLRQEDVANALPHPAYDPEYPVWEPVPARLDVLPLPPGPGKDLATARRLFEKERWLDAVLTLIMVAEADPQRLVEALRLSDRRLQDVELARAGVQQLDALAAETMKTLDRDGKARIALALADRYNVGGGGQAGRRERLEAVAKEYADTEAGLLAAYRAIGATDAPTAKVVPALHVFADRHPGTEAARRALESVAFQYAGPNLCQQIPESGERFRRLALVAARLQSDEFPGPQGPLSATSKLVGFFITKDRAPSAKQKAAATAMLEAYRVLFRHHFLVDVIEGQGCTVPFSLEHSFADLHAALGVPKEELSAAVDAELEALEAALPDKGAIRYLRAERLARGDDLEGADRAFAKVQEDYTGTLYARKALAARAGLAYAAGELKTAERLYERYLEAHGTTSFAWLAALRIGHGHTRSGDPHRAIEAYQSVDRSNPAYPPVLGVHLDLALARSFESIGQVEKAVQAYERALAAWPAGEITRIATQGEHPLPDRLWGSEPDLGVHRSAIAARLRWLTRPDAEPAVLRRLLEGDRLLERERSDEALKVWAALAADHPESPLAKEARERTSRVWIDRALDAAGGSVKTPDLATALAAIAKADDADGPFGRVAAALVQAALWLRSGEDAKAYERVKDALRLYAASQTLAMPEHGIDADAAGMLRAAFAPHHPGYRIRGKAGTYVVVPATIGVKRADGVTETVEVRPPLPEHPNVLYFTLVESRQLERIIGRMGMPTSKETSRNGTSPPRPGSPESIAGLLGRFFPVRAGHWGGWHIFTYPTVLAFRFLDAEHKTAVGNFRVGYQGGDATLEQKGGTWRLIEVAYRWIE